MERVRDLLDAVGASFDPSDASMDASRLKKSGRGGNSSSANIAAEDFSSDLQIREVASSCASTAFVCVRPCERGS